MSLMPQLRRHWPLFVMLLICLPVSFPGGNGAGLMSGHNLLVWACATLWAGNLWLQRAGAIIDWKLYVALPLGLLLMTLPLLWTPLYTWRLNALPRLIGLWSGFGLLILLLRTRFGLQGRTLILIALAVAGAVQALLALAQLLFPLSSLAQHLLQYDVLAAQGRALGSFGQVNLLGSFLSVCAGATLWCLLSSSSRRLPARLCGYCALILMLTTLAAIRSRTGWLGGVLACGGVLWLAGRQGAWRMMAGCVLLSGMCTLSVLQLQPQVQAHAASSEISAPGKETFSLERMREESRNRRLQMLRVTVALIMQHPLAGNGLGSFERLWSDGLTAQGEVSATPERVIYPHNELLYVWSEGGLVALAGLMLVGGLWLLPLSTVRHLRTENGRLATRNRRYLAIWPLTLPLMLHTMTEFPFYLSALHFVLFLLLWRLALPDGPARGTTYYSTPISRATVAVTCMAVLVVLTICGMNLYILRDAEKKGFSSPPALVLPAVSALMQSDRLQFDRSVSLLIAFNQPRDVALLHDFVGEAGLYLSAHNDPNLMDSYIRVTNALGQADFAGAMLHRAHVSFPEDPRFSPAGERP